MTELFEQILADLERDEGFRSQVYKCTADKWTIGFGRNVEDRGITKDEARILLANDASLSWRELSDRLSWFDRAPDQVKRGLVNMHMNLGWPTLLKFQKMLAALAAGDYARAADEALDSRWAEQVGSRSERIADLYRSAA